MKPVTRKTKIVATLGPASFDPSIIKKLVQNGANVFRLNFSHQDQETAKTLIRTIRNISKELNKSIGILLDLQGPKIRIGSFNKSPVYLRKGQTFTITTCEAIAGTKNVVSTSYREIVKDVKKGDVILLDDGRIRLKVKDKNQTEVITTVVVGGALSNKKGMNLPKRKVSAEVFTKKTLDDIAFGIEQKIDYFALSFVQNGNDIKRIKKIIAEKNSAIKVIAKIENQESVNNIDEIIDESDSIMVARGDLGIELSLERVPILQKEIIRKANYQGKPVIVATQMLETMIENPIPTRAEVSDVATAIYDWADAIMLSGETAAGKYPVITVKTMAKIAATVDKDQARRKKKLKTRRAHFIEDSSISCSLSDSADELADEIGAKALITFTDTGKTARLLSKHRTAVPILAVADTLSVFYQLSLLRGVKPLLSSILFSQMKGVRNMLEEADRLCLQSKMVKKGDMVVMLAGIPIASSGSTSMIRVRRIGESL